MVSTSPLSISTPLPARSVPSVSAVKASGGMIECRPTTARQRALEVVAVVLRRAAARTAALSIRSARPCQALRAMSATYHTRLGCAARRCAAVHDSVSRLAHDPALHPRSFAGLRRLDRRRRRCAIRSISRGLPTRLGYTRYWVAEHHNLPAIASSAPDIMIGQIAAVTTHMRVGSGGVMLPNHAPLMVAERFKVLEALFPGRIDLGLGRAPGTDPATSYALRRRQGISEEDDFLERFNELMLLETRGFPAGHPFHNVRAMPADVPLPPIYLLGSSDYSARSLPARSARRFPSRTTSPLSTRPKRCGSTATISGPRPSHDKPYAILATHVGLRRHRRGGRAAGGNRRSEFRAPRQGRIPAARLAGGGRGLRLHAGRPRAHRAEPRAHGGRLARHRDGAGSSR